MYDGRVYALKKVSKKFAMRWKGELIKREFEIMRSVKHPFIVRLFASYSDERDYNFLMEYCPGGTLYELIRKFRSLPVPMALYYFCEMLLAIEYLHSRNVMFRDLKAENILVDAKGHLKLTDFGLALKLEEREDLADSYCGSPIYIAPETLQRQRYDRRVDFYALGVLLYEMIVGTPPFINKNTTTLKEMKIQGDVRYPKVIDPGVKNILEKCLAKVKSSDKEPSKRCSEFKYYYAELKSLGVDHLQVLSNSDLLVYDQELAKRNPRNFEVNYHRNSSFDCKADKYQHDIRLQNNYEYLEKEIQFNRLKTRELTAQKTKPKFNRKDFSFGKLQIPGQQPLSKTPIIVNPSSTLYGSSHQSYLKQSNF